MKERRAIFIFLFLYTGKLQESADDKKTWKHKTDKCLMGGVH